MGRRSAWIDENGARTDYDYDGLGRLSFERDPEGTITTYAWDVADRLVSVTQPGSGSTCSGTKVNCISYSYDLAGGLSGVDYSDPATPDVSGVVYDPLGRRTAWTSDGATETWSWDARSRVTSHLDANGRTTGYGYDATSNLTSIAYPGTSTPLTRSFDDAGRLVSTTDWLGNTTGFGYDANDNWTSTTFPASTQNVDTFGYDRADRMTSVSWKQATTVLGSIDYGTRDNEGQVTAASGTGAGTPSRTWAYDNRDRLTNETGGAGGAITYDPAGNVTERADGALQVFDPASRLCWTSDTAASGTCATPAADATTFAYDAKGNRTGQQPHQGRGSTYGYDQANRLTSAAVPSGYGDGQMVTFSPIKVLDTRATPVGACSPSPCGRLAANATVTVTPGGVGGYASSGVGAMWATIRVHNPAAAGVLEVNEAGTSAAVTLNYEASLDGSTTAIVPLSASGTLTLKASTATDVSIESTGYFRSGEGTGTTYQSLPATRLVDTRNGTGTCNGAACAKTPAGTLVQINAAGQAGLPASGAAAAVVIVSVDTPEADGNLVVAPGTGGIGAGRLDYQDYESISETVIAPIVSGKITLQTSTSVHVQIDVTGYFTAPSGNLGLGMHTIAPTRLVDSDTASGPCVPAPCADLVSAQRQTVQVAGNGGVPASASAVVGYLTLTDPTSYGFVQINPNFWSGMGLSGEQTVAFEATDPRNSLAMVPLKPDGTIELVSTVGTGWTLDVSGYLTQPAATFNYRYDPTGLRKAKTGPAAWGAPTTYTWTDPSLGLPLLLSQHQSGFDMRFVYGPGNQPIAQITTGLGTSWYHHDQLGSIRMTTSATGTVTGTSTYDAYGNLTGSTGLQPALGYTSAYRDTETGFLYLRARTYDPTTNQFRLN